MTNFTTRPHYAHERSPMNRSFGGSRNRSGYLAKIIFFHRPGFELLGCAACCPYLVFKLACMGSEPRVFGKVSSPIGTELFSPLVDTNNVLHDLYTRVFVLRMRWAGKVSRKRGTDIHTQFHVLLTLHLDIFI
jgi:hypothetical protein